MILQQAIKALDTQTLQDAAKKSIYDGRKFIDFDGRSYYWRLQELQRCSANGVKCGDALKLQALRDYIIYRWNKDKCFASQKRMCEDLTIKDRETLRWMLRVLVWSGHIRKLPYNHFTGTNQYVPNFQNESGDITGLWHDWTAQLISKARKFTLLSQEDKEVNQEEENSISFFESLHDGISSANIPSEYYLEEQAETYQLDTNTEFLNDSSFSEDTTLNATYPESGLTQEPENTTHQELTIIEETEIDVINLPVRTAGYCYLQALAAEIGVNTIQEAIKELIKIYEESKKKEEVKQQSPLGEVATLDATQPAKVVEKEVELLDAIIPPIPEKRKYREYELIQQEARIKNYLAGKQKEFDIPGVNELITQEKARISRLPDDLLMEYPIPNPGTEEALQGIIEGNRIKEKRESLANDFFDWLRSCAVIDDYYALCHALCSALLRNDSEIMNCVAC